MKLYFISSKINHIFKVLLVLFFFFLINWEQMKKKFISTFHNWVTLLFKMSHIKSDFVYLKEIDYILLFWGPWQNSILWKLKSVIMTAICWI